MAASCGWAGNKSKPLPDFTLPVVSRENQKVQLQTVNGENPVLLVFWATWCPSCVEEIPVLNQWQEKYGPQGLKILGVNVQEKQPDIQKFMAKHKIEYPILLDQDGEVTNRYGLVGLPVSIYMAKGGEVLYYGFSLPANIEQFLAPRTKESLT